MMLAQGSISKLGGYILYIIDGLKPGDVGSRRIEALLQGEPKT